MDAQDPMKQFLDEWQALRLNGSATVFYVEGRPVKVEVAGFKNLVPRQELTTMEILAKAKSCGRIGEAEGGCKPEGKP